MFASSRKQFQKVYRAIAHYGLATFFAIGFIAGCSGGYIFGGLATKNIQLLPFVLLFILGPLVALIGSLFWSLNKLGTKKVRAMINASTGYMLASFLLLIWTYLNKTVGVEFATTFPELLHNKLLSGVVSILGAPLGLLGIDFETSTMITALSEHSAMEQTTRIHWRNWVLGTMLLFGILPRFFLLCFATVLGKRSQKRVMDQKRLQQFAIELEKDGDPFSIGSEELRLLMSLQAMIVRSDIDNEPDAAKKKTKMSWYTHWKDLQKKVRDAAGEEGLLKPLNENPEHLLEECKRLVDAGYQKMGMLFLEASLFEPYFDLQAEGADSKQAYPSLSSSDFSSSASEKKLLQFVKKTGFEATKLNAALRSYHDILDDLMNRKQIKSLGYWLGGAFLATGLGLALGPAFLAAIGLKGAVVKLLSSLALSSGVLVLAKLGAAKGLLLVVCGGSLWGATHKIADIYGFRGGSERIVKDIAKFEATILHLFNLNYKDALQLIEQKLKDAKTKIASAIDQAPESQSKKELKKCQAAIEHRLAKSR